MAGERLFRLVLLLSVASVLWVVCGFGFSLFLDAGSAFIVGALVAGVFAVLLNWRLRK